MLETLVQSPGAGLQTIIIVITLTIETIRNNNNNSNNINNNISNNNKNNTRNNNNISRFGKCRVLGFRAGGGFEFTASRFRSGFSGGLARAVGLRFSLVRVRALSLRFSIWNYGFRVLELRFSIQGLGFDFRVSSNPSARQ